ncbi:hypothetical protein ACFLWN_01395 [Chloroflexota bacterium]
MAFIWYLNIGGIFDLYCGVALAADSFTLAGWVYLFNRERYHAVARPAATTTPEPTHT